MKKVWAILLAIFLLLSIVACGKTDAPQNTPASAAREGTRPVETLPRPTAMPTEPTETLPQGPITIEKTDEDLLDVPDFYGVPDYGEEYPHLDEQVLFDDGTVRLTMEACDLIPDFSGHYHVPVALENNSDLHLKAYTFGFAINGRMTTCGLFTDAEPHSTAEDNIILIQSDLNRAAMGFDVPRDFQIQVGFFDVDREDESDRYAVGDIVSFSAEPAYYARDTFTPYPTVLYQSENLCIRAGMFYLLHNGCTQLQLCIENYSEDTLNIKATNIKINGEDTKDQIIGNILPGCTSIDYLEFTEVGTKYGAVSLEDFSELVLQFSAVLNWDGEIIDSSDILCLNMV